MSTQEWAMRNLTNGEEHVVGTGPYGSDAWDEAVHLARRHNKAGIPATVVTREIPDFYATYDPYQDETALCETKGCLHPYGRHFDKDDIEMGIMPRALCQYCDCMDFTDPRLVEAKKKAAVAAASEG